MRGSARGFTYRRVSAVVSLAALIALGAGDVRATTPPGDDPLGPSLLRRAGLQLDSSVLGRLGGVAPALAEATREPTQVRPHTTFRIEGADLYRMACQSCHGADAKGAPPEINDLLGPAQATSAALTAQRLRELDHPVDDALMNELAASAASALRQQIRTGGPKMPSFEFLRAEEVDAILAYLQQMAGVPAQERTPTKVQEEPATRVGELLARGTCHTCHDATGASPSGHMMMMPGVIPSLASFAKQRSVDQIVAKVRDGRGAIMPMMPMMWMHGRAQMPVYPYLTPQEITAACVYLASLTSGS